LDELNEKLQQARADNDGLTRETEQLRSDLQDLKDQVAASEKRLSALQAERDSLQGEIENVKSQMGGLQVAAEGRQKLQADLKDARERLGELDELNEKLQQARADNDGLTRETQHAGAGQLAASEKRLSALQAERDSLGSQLRKAKSELSSLRQGAESAAEGRRKLEGGPKPAAQADIRVSAAERAAAEEAAGHFWNALAHADTEAMKAHYSKEVILGAESKLLRAHCVAAGRGGGLGNPKVARAELIAAYDALIADLTPERWRRIFGNLSAEAIDMAVARYDGEHFEGVEAGDMVMTVTAGPGYEELTHVFRRTDSGRWLVVAQQTDY